MLITLGKDATREDLKKSLNLSAPQVFNCQNKKKDIYARGFHGKFIENMYYKENMLGFQNGFALK